MLREEIFVNKICALATLAWLLSQLHLPETLPGAISREALTTYAASLEARMRNVARPGSA